MRERGALRAEYHRHLRELAREVIALGTAVWDNMGRATDAIVDYDLGLVDDTIAADDRIDRFSRELEDHAVLVLAREAPVASELAYVVSLLRLAYELERCGDLMVNVARATHRLGAPLEDGPVKDALRHLANQSRAIFAEALQLYEAGQASDLHEADDEVDAAHTQLLKELAEPVVDPRTIIALTIAGRCYERVGDHAVNMAERSHMAGVAQEETGVPGTAE